MPIIKPKRMATILVPDDLQKKLKAIAKREGRLLQVVVEEIIIDGLKSRKAA